MATSYSPSRFSPYFLTKQSGSYLGIAQLRKVPAEKDDILYEITSQYEFRPDLLAFDLYGDSQLWWVFSVRNKDVISDPIYDMYAGQKIYLPKKPLLQRAIGF